MPWESKLSWKGGSRKFEVVFHLLQVTKDLDSLEITEGRNGRRNEDESNVHPGCLLGLEGPFNSLKHLRPVALSNESQIRNRIGIYYFNNLKVLYTDQLTLKSILSLNQQLQPKKMPLLESIYLDCYLYLSKLSKTCDEEYILSLVLKADVFPSLKEVAVPANPVDHEHEPTTNDEVFINSWSKVS